MGGTKAQSWCIECRKGERQGKEPTVAVTFEVVDDAVWEAENPYQTYTKPAGSRAKYTNDVTSITDPNTFDVAVDGKFQTGQLTRDKDQTRELFQQVFPNNTHPYGWVTMARRLVKKLGSHILSPEADLELNGVV